MGTHTLSGSKLVGAFCDKTSMSVLAVLFAHPDEPLHLREIIRRAAKGQGAVQRTLSRLTEAGILTVQSKAQLRLYQPNRNCVIYKELRQIIDKTMGVSAVLEEALKPLRTKIQWAFIYGSIASGKETAGSDVDLAVIGSAELSEVVGLTQKAESRINRPVNVTLYSKHEFFEKAESTGSFVARILKGPKIMILGDSHELERLGK